MSYPSTTGHGATISSRASSNESIALVRTWLDDCDGNHEVCRTAVGNRNPTRSIRVKTSAKATRMYLVDIELRLSRYVALS